MPIFLKFLKINIKHSLIGYFAAIFPLILLFCTAGAMDRAHIAPKSILDLLQHPDISNIILGSLNPYEKAFRYLALYSSPCTNGLNHLVNDVDVLITVLGPEIGDTRLTGNVGKWTKFMLTLLKENKITINKKVLRTAHVAPYNYTSDVFIQYLLRTLPHKESVVFVLPLQAKKDNASFRKLKEMLEERIKNYVRIISIACSLPYTGEEMELAYRNFLTTELKRMKLDAKCTELNIFDIKIADEYNKWHKIFSDCHFTKQQLRDLMLLAYKIKNLAGISEIHLPRYADPGRSGYAQFARFFTAYVFGVPLIILASCYLFESNKPLYILGSVYIGLPIAFIVSIHHETKKDRGSLKTPVIEIIEAYKDLFGQFYVYIAKQADQRRALERELLPKIVTVEKVSSTLAEICCDQISKANRKKLKIAMKKSKKSVSV